MDAVGRAVPGQHPQGQRRAEELSDDGGIGHAFHAHAQKNDENQIQNGIDNRGKNQEIQRAAGIPHGPENAGTHIIGKQTQHAGKINGQIGMGLRENILRGGLKPQQRIRAQNAYSRKRRPQQEGDADRRMHGMMQSLVVMAAVALGDDHAGPGGQSGGKAHQRIDNAGSSTHCG